MKIAIIGAGISGLTCAYLLSKEHDVYVFEKSSRIGGHTATIDVEHEGKIHAIDTGFIVYNDWTYPNFIKLMQRLEVQNQPSSMGFSVSDPTKDFEYAGNSINTLFSQRRHLVSPSFWKMLKDIVRFNKSVMGHIEQGIVESHTTLGEYLDRFGYSKAFCDHYLIPMGAAIWSASMGSVKEFPLLFFARFFHNHGLLNLVKRPTWRVISGGSRSYLSPLTAPFKDNILTDAHIFSIYRRENGVELSYTLDRERERSTEMFDGIVMATHSDQALSLLSDASQLEKEILGAIAYQENSVVLHTDTSLLPRNKRTWSSWNVILGDDLNAPPVLTYNMNMLQGLKAKHTYCVTLNADEKIDPNKILGTFSYAHPQFNLAAQAAQRRYEELGGVNNTWFCGAYWSNGFHEDGVCSALRVAKDFNLTL